MANPKSKARELVLQFLYQCEAERLFHFSEQHFREFAHHQSMPSDVDGFARALAEGVLSDSGTLDDQIQEASANWKLSRMSMIDRAILRLATYELMRGEAPPKVVMNEAVELAKRYGSGDSSRFVNGILDRLARTVVPASRAGRD